MKVEVVVYNPESVMIAEKCGADRVELCANAMAGGTSPGIAMLELIKEKYNIPVFTMVRPREGDFCYSKDEIKVILREISLFKKAGADGIVSAVLNEKNEVNVEVLNQMIETAYPLPFTFHRAFDFTNDPWKALDAIISCGCTRILTSGQKKSAMEGADLIKSLIEKAGKDLVILPGAGINSANVLALIKKTGCSEIHLSAKKIINRNTSLNAMIQLGSEPDFNAYQITDTEELLKVIHSETAN